jgi:hypothetical protein
MGTQPKAAQMRTDVMTSQGEPAPIQYALHVTVYGEHPGRIILRRIVYFGR